jgi:hypothetical protein
MTNRSRRSAADRAEARRRARLAAQGREDELDAVEASDVSEDRGAPPRSGTFLTRLFPPAPPLPGKPDPLAGFAYTGPLRGVVASLYLLARHPVAWIGMGAVWAAGRLALEVGPMFGPIVTIASSLLAFGALIAAGWIGWPKPWLFGLMASIFGIVMYAILFGQLVGAAQTEFSVGQVVVGSAYREVAGLQPLFGALAGWYGGYLRRRMASAPSSAEVARGRRR